jgi:hypothetical protein
MNKPELTTGRIILAFAIAMMADMIQFPIAAVTATGILAVPAEIADFSVDCFVMVAASLLIGFHWVLLPSLFVELIPGLDLCPTWTGCVAFVVWQRKKKKAQPPAPCRILNVKEAQVVSAPPLFGSIIPAQLPPPIESSVEQRLKSLIDLRDKNLISQSEYESKRQQVLSGL